MSTLNINNNIVASGILVSLRVGCSLVLAGMVYVMGKLEVSGTLVVV